MSEHGPLEALQNVLPANRTPLVEESIRALERLPGVEKWKPPGLFAESTIPWEVLWGFPFTFLTNIASLEPLRKKIGACIGKGQEPDPTNRAEVSAAALAKALDARHLERIQETNCPTADFQVWWENELVEMEVTRADRKKTEIDRMEAIDRLRDHIRSFGRLCDIVIHVADIPSEDDRQQILQAARDMEPGTQRESQGRWCVRAERPHREGNYHVAGGESDPAPAWWPEKGLTRLFSLQQLVGGPDPKEVHPQVRIQFGTPLSAYMNPVANKADHFQGSENIPFVIAVDVMALPGAFEFFPGELPEYFSAWPHVSGVLLVHGPAFIGVQVGWMWRLIANPRPRNPLPSNMLARIRAESNTKAYDLMTN